MWLTEDDLTKQFSALIAQLKMPKNEVEGIVTTLKSSHKDKSEFHNSLLNSYQSEHRKLENRIEKAWEDKIDGSITQSFYEEKRKEYRDKQKVLNSKMGKLQVADEEYYLNSEYLLKIALHAKELFESSEAQEKRLLLKMTLQNLRLEGKIVRYDWIKPFGKIAYYASRLDWLALTDYVGNYYRNFLMAENVPVAYIS